jgi:hypothetical protein
MRAICFALLFSLFIDSAMGQENDYATHLRNCGAEIQKAIDQLCPKAKVEQAKSEMKVGCEVRKYLAHRRLFNGEWSDDATTVTGPERVGWLIVLSFCHGAYEDGLVRDEGAAVVYENAFREPYFLVCLNLIAFDGGFASVEVYFGDSVDKTSLNKVYARVFKAVQKEFGEVKK